MSTPYTNNAWMAATPRLDILSLNELSLPGTHNAGSDWRASYPFFGPPAHWLACQHDRFYRQLHNGARVLDIRLMADSKESGLERFRIHHNGFPNSRRLGDLITDVKNFLNENPDEFVILDFHKTDGDSFDYAYFNKMMIQLLGHRLIPATNANLSLGTLKRLSDKQRVLAAVRRHPDIDHSVFIDEIRHEWSGSGTTNTQELYQHITNVLRNPPGNWRPWSLSATSYSALGGPVDIHDKLNEWFDPDTSDWARQCNIINVDFIEETRIVDYCRTMNLIKADQRQRQFARERAGATAV
ncbi:MULTISPECIES: phosphatidylinositol-specific phospholipase C domain-containing protein [unclassified Pseudomonas]|uniref:phosphatidylinositol-specific phospholipase C domain-containing protein n=1 Tax=unclassified Pseudomonas TaxID=196821 RepID=UPI000A1DA2C7|nr:MULTISPECIES: phosphatidylinositol-specific phospholipase C domain-containing protein [unclassified Pseudomonas]